VEIKVLGEYPGPVPLSTTDPTRISVGINLVLLRY